jgi:hypothetical protein
MAYVSCSWAGEMKQKQHCVFQRNYRLKYVSKQNYLHVISSPLCLFELLSPQFLFLHQPKGFFVYFSSSEVCLKKCLKNKLWEGNNQSSILNMTCQSDQYLELTLT